MFKILPTIVLLTTYFVSAYTTAEQTTSKILIALDKQLIEHEHRYGNVSQSILVKKQNRIIFRKAHGKSSLELSTPAHENNLYPMYSIAKLFASVTLMKLVEQGKADLDKSITFYLPKLPKSWADVSLRHCLNHTSGIPEYFTMEYTQTGFPNTLNDVFLKIADNPFQFKTGDRNQYNNTNFLVIGAIIEKITKRTYLEAVHETVITPLSLSKTLYSQSKEVLSNLVSSYWGKKGKMTVDKGVDWPSYSFTHSGLYSTKADLLRFIEGVAAGNILSEKTLYNMWQPMKLNNGSTGQYASGWEYAQEGEFVRVGHEGGNRVRLEYFFKPSNKKENYTSIYLTNGHGYQNGITTHLVDAMMSILAPDDFSTLILKEKLLDGAFNQTLDKSDNLFNEIMNNQFISADDKEKFIRERGYTIFYSSKTKYAIDLFEFYATNFPKSALGWDHLAEAWLSVDNKQKAIKYFKKALTIDENVSNTKEKLTELLKQQEK